MIHVGGGPRSGKTTRALEIFASLGGTREGEDILWFDDGLRSYAYGMRDLWGARPIPKDISQLVGIYPSVIIVSSDSVADMTVFLGRWPLAQIEQVQGDK